MKMVDTTTASSARHIALLVLVNWAGLSFMRAVFLWAGAL
jgi:hypothetical protein